MSGRYFFFVSVFTTRAIYMADFPAREKVQFVRVSFRNWSFGIAHCSWFVLIIENGYQI